MSTFNISPITIDAIGAFDGRFCVGDFVGQLNDLLKRTVLQELGRLIRLGYIQGVSPEHRLVIDQERVVNSYLKESQVLAPDAFSAMELQRVRRDGLLTHPWLSRIHVTTEGKVQCHIDSTMARLDFESMFDALQYLINKVTIGLAARVGKTKANAALFKARVTAKRSQGI